MGVFLCGKLSRSRWFTSPGEVVTTTICQESPSDQFFPVTTSLGGWWSRYVMPPPGSYHEVGWVVVQVPYPVEVVTPPEVVSDPCPTEVVR